MDSRPKNSMHSKPLTPTFRMEPTQATLRPRNKSKLNPPQPRVLPLKPTPIMTMDPVPKKNTAPTADSSTGGPAAKALVDWATIAAMAAVMGASLAFRSYDRYKD